MVHLLMRSNLVGVLVKLHQEQLYVGRTTLNQLWCRMAYKDAISSANRRLPISCLTFVAEEVAAVGSTQAFPHGTDLLEMPWSPHRRHLEVY